MPQSRLQDALEFGPSQSYQAPPMPLALSQRSHLICLPRLAGSLALALGLVLPLGQSARARSPASAPPS